MENTQKSFIVKSWILGKRSFVRVKEKQRKKFHWWYIPLGIVLVLVLTAGGLVLWMHSMLPWPNMVAMTSNFQM